MPTGSSTVGSSETHLVLPRLQTPRSPSPDPPRNIIWLTPTSLSTVNSQLRLHCTYQEPGPFVVHPPLGEVGPDASSSCATLHEILERYGARIVSMELDASLFPNPEEEETIACPLELPLHPSSKLYGDQIHGVAPNLPYLTELKIHTARKVSTRSLLALLCATLALKTLEVKNQALHQAVLPEDLGELPQVNLGHLQQLTILGVSSDTANACCRSSAALGRTITPLRDTLSTVRHAHLSCDAIKRQKGGSDVYRVIFTDNDERSRFQLHWECETRLHDIFKPTMHTILVFSSGADDAGDQIKSVLQAIQSLPAETAQVVVLARHRVPEPRDGSAAYHDMEGHAFGAYRVKDDKITVVAVRPDAYIGAFVRDAGGIKEYFSCILRVAGA
ncbi:hypothetical protein NUW54_g5862 [Trametes sanguinea]|uniref:Uncharacterized protein n=1 Tax=Trametes sanguinea TaxID=158606 RepID=A0ACC1PTY8_9APHY|nr:hypothetical protein NUW54_g5862 [Trametes sanguinea]